MIRFNVICISWIVLDIFIGIQKGFGSTWSEWWSYEGISGPEFWGLVNPEWYVCMKGKRQSPIDIDPKHLLFDPNLQNLKIDKHRMNGILVNTGHDVRLQLEEPVAPHFVNISGGPLAYQYRVTEVIFHFGSINESGSEHTINGAAFPAEIQILGYNSDLYGNMSHAAYSTNGLAMISLLAQIGKKSNPELEAILQHLDSIRYKGQQVGLSHISLYGLLPHTDNYVTYEGSMTQPGCQETVTWIIFNKPVYISNENLLAMRALMQGEQNNPKISMSNNFRSKRPTNSRPIRTNINFQNPTSTCNMDRQMFYQSNILERS